MLNDLKFTVSGNLYIYIYILKIPGIFFAHPNIKAPPIRDSGVSLHMTVQSVSFPKPNSGYTFAKAMASRPPLSFSLSEHGHFGLLYVLPQ